MKDLQANNPVHRAPKTPETKIPELQGHCGIQSTTIWHFASVCRIACENTISLDRFPHQGRIAAMLKTAAQLSFLLQGSLKRNITDNPSVMAGSAGKESAWHLAFLPATEC